MLNRDIYQKDPSTRKLVMQTREPTIRIGARTSG